VEGHRDRSRPWLLAPCDLQAVKASGSPSWRASSSASSKSAARQSRPGRRRPADIQAIVGPDLRGVRPGSPEPPASRTSSSPGTCGRSISRWDRSRCRALHQVSAHGRGRPGRPRGHSSRLRLEQPRA
jgi:hypothetical protein